MGRSDSSNTDVSLTKDIINFLVAVKHDVDMTSNGSETPLIRKSSDALVKLLAPPLDPPVLPLEQKIPSRAKEAILKWKHDLPSPPSTISLDGSLGSEPTRQMWESHVDYCLPSGISSESQSRTQRQSAAPAESMDTDSLQVLHGPLQHIAERSPPHSYPPTEPRLPRRVAKSHGIEVSRCLAHYVPSKVNVTTGHVHQSAYSSDESPNHLSRDSQKTTDERPVSIPLPPLSTSYAETQTPPERTRDNKGTVVRRDKRPHKEHLRRKNRSKSRDRYEEIMEMEYNKQESSKISEQRNHGITVLPSVKYPDIDRSVVYVKSARRNYDSDDEDMSCGHWCEYVIVVVLSSILLVASVVLVLFWCLYYRKGYAWNDNPVVQFNLHPTLMITGFIFFSGFSMLLYRISRCCRRIYVKLLHTLFHTLAIPCVVLGFMAVLDYHNLANPPIPNFYSIHSWMGLVTMGLFALQFVVGFFSFLLLLCCDSATANFRASLVPVHATFGLTTFMLAIATCLTGLTERAFFNFGSDYGNYPEEGIIMNALAMVLVALAILVSYAVRREPLRVHSISYVSERL